MEVIYRNTSPEERKKLADPNCYRQILASLFSCVVKLMERIIDK